MAINNKQGFFKFIFNRELDDVSYVTKTVIHAFRKKLVRAVNTQAMLVMHSAALQHHGQHGLLGRADCQLPGRSWRLFIFTLAAPN